jgi:hypothetical protein
MEFQEIAKKRRNLPLVIRNYGMTQCERELLDRIVGELGVKIKESKEKEMNSGFKPESQQKIVRLANSVSYTCYRGMFKQGDEEKRYQNIFLLIT